MEKCMEVVALPPPPSPPLSCCLQGLTIRNCIVFTACKNERFIFEVLFNCTHINNDINNRDVIC